MGALGRWHRGCGELASPDSQIMVLIGHCHRRGGERGDRVVVDMPAGACGFESHGVRHNGVG